MLFKTIVAALLAVAFLVGCAASPQEPEAGPKIESKGMVPNGAKKIDGAGGGITKTPE